MKTLQIIYRPAGRAGEYAELAANLYSGCVHGCLYCYAPQALRRNRADFHENVKPRKDALKKFERDCRALADNDFGDSPQKTGQSLKILLSFTCDPYQQLESEWQLTRQAIKIAHKCGLGVQILTKAPATASYDFDLLGPTDAFAVTLTFLDSRDSRHWEPLADPPEDRIHGLERAKRLGIPTWASLEPVIDPEQSLSLIEMTAPVVDLFKVGKLNYHPLAKEIDWHDFGWKAKELLEKLGKKYIIKEDLKREMRRRVAGDDTSKTSRG